MWKTSVEAKFTPIVKSCVRIIDASLQPEQVISKPFSGNQFPVEYDHLMSVISTSLSPIERAFSCRKPTLGARERGQTVVNFDEILSE